MSAILSTRMSNLRRRMADTGTGLVAIGPSSHMQWLADLSPHGDERPVLLLVGAQFAGFLMPALNVESARQHTDLPFFPWSDADGPEAALGELLDAVGIDRSDVSVVLDETMRADFALLLLDALPGARRRFTTDTVGALRARKDEAEYRVLKANALLDDAAMQAAFGALRPGISEEEVVTLVRDFFAANDARTAFATVSFGENGAFPHHHSGTRKLGENEPVLIDIGSRMDGYPSDMTRVGHIGEPGAEFLKVHAIVEQAVNAALAALRPGVLAKDIDRAAREVITAAGYGDKFIHRTGHGLGIDLHEMPYLTASAETVLEEGHVFSIEPGIYLPGQFGLRLEEIVILRGDGPEILSELPRAPFIA